MTMKRIEQWSVVVDPYAAPEVRVARIHGYCPDRPGHDRDPEKRVMTSRIVAAEGRVVTTRSGSQYVLGEPSPEYVAELARQGIALDPDHPVRVFHSLEEMRQAHKEQK